MATYLPPRRAAPLTALDVGTRALEVAQTMSLRLDPGDLSAPQNADQALRLTVKVLNEVATNAMLLPRTWTEPAFGVMSREDLRSAVARQEDTRNYLLLKQAPLLAGSQPPSEAQLEEAFRQMRNNHSSQQRREQLASSEIFIGDMPQDVKYELPSTGLADVDRQLQSLTGLEKELDELKTGYLQTLQALRDEVQRGLQDPEADAASTDVLNSLKETHLALESKIEIAFLKGPHKRCTLSAAYEALRRPEDPPASAVVCQSDFKERRIEDATKRLLFDRSSASIDGAVALAGALEPETSWGRRTLMSLWSKDGLERGLEGYPDRARDPSQVATEILEANAAALEKLKCKEAECDREIQKQIDTIANLVEERRGYFQRFLAADELLEDLSIELEVERANKARLEADRSKLEANLEALREVVEQVQSKADFLIQETSCLQSGVREDFHRLAREECVNLTPAILGLAEKVAVGKALCQKRAEYVRSWMKPETEGGIGCSAVDSDSDEERPFAPDEELAKCSDVENSLHDVEICLREAARHQSTLTPELDEKFELGSELVEALYKSRGAQRWKPPRPPRQALPARDSMVDMLWAQVHQLEKQLEKKEAQERAV